MTGESRSWFEVSNLGACPAWGRCDVSFGRLRLSVALGSFVLEAFFRSTECGSRNIELDVVQVSEGHSPIVLKSLWSSCTLFMTLISSLSTSVLEPFVVMYWTSSSYWRSICTRSRRLEIGIYWSIVVLRVLVGVVFPFCCMW